MAAEWVYSTYTNVTILLYINSYTMCAVLPCKGKMCTNKTCILPHTCTYIYTRTYLPYIYPTYVTANMYKTQYNTHIQHSPYGGVTDSSEVVLLVILLLIFVPPTCTHSVSMATSWMPSGGRVRGKMVESSSNMSTMIVTSSTENVELVCKRKVGGGRDSRVVLKKGAALRGLLGATCTRMNNSVVT